MDDLFIVDSAPLAKELRLACDFIPDRTRHPIVMNVLLETGDNELRISATNLNLNVTRSMVARTDQPFKALVPADLLRKIATGCPGELLIKTTTLQDEPAVLICHRERAKGLPGIHGDITSDFKLFTAPIAEFPAITCLDPEHALMHVNALDLIAALRGSLPAHKDHLSYGIVIRPDPTDSPSATVAASNGMMMAVYGNVRITPLADGDVVMDLELAEAMLDVLEREQKTRTLADSVEIRVKKLEGRECAISIVGDTWQITANRCKAVWPDGAIEMAREQKAIFGAVPANDFITAFKQLKKTAIASQQSGSHGLVAFAISPKGITMTAEHETTSAERVIAGAGNGELTVKVPVKQLEAWLRSVPAREWIGIGANSPYEPILLLTRALPHAKWLVAGQNKQDPAKETAEAPSPETAAVAA